MATKNADVLLHHMMERKESDASIEIPSQDVAQTPLQMSAAADMCR